VICDVCGCTVTTRPSPRNPPGGGRFLCFSDPGLLASLLASNRYIKKMPRKY